LAHGGPRRQAPRHIHEALEKAAVLHESILFGILPPYIRMRALYMIYPDCPPLCGTRSRVCIISFPESAISFEIVPIYPNN
jgi:hypothetical protein